MHYFPDTLYVYIFSSIDYHGSGVAKQAINIVIHYFQSHKKSTNRYTVNADSFRLVEIGHYLS